MHERVTNNPPNGRLASPIQDYLTRLHARLSQIGTGKVATYIPELANASPAWFGIVVATGLVGRYFYGLIPGSNGRAAELAELLGQAERLKERLGPTLAGAAAPAPLRALFEQASAAPPRAPLLRQLLRSALETVAFRLRLAVTVRRFPSEGRAALGEGLVELMRLRRQLSLFGGIHRLMRAWRSIHVSLAVMLVVALLAHISVAVYLGYGPGGR